MAALNESEQHRELAVAAYAAGRFSVCEQESLAAIALDARDLRAHETLGLALIAMRRAQDADEAMLRALRHFPGVARLLRLRAIALSSRSMHGEAVSVAREALRNGGATAVYLVTLAEVLPRTDRAEVDALMRQALAQDPQSHGARLFSAQRALEQANAAEALPHVQWLLKHDANVTQALVFHSRLLLLQGNAKEAATVAHRALLQSPNDALAWPAYARALVQQGEWESAVQAAEECLRLGAELQWARVLLNAYRKRARSQSFCPTCGLCYPSASRRCIADNAALVALPPPFIGGSIRGGYALVSERSGGELGRIFEATDRSQQRVAVRLISPKVTRGKPNVDPWFYSVARASEVPSDRWAKTLAAGVDPALGTYLVTTWIQGVPLTELLGTEALTWQRKTLLMTEMLSLLAKAHGAGVVHGNLKPQYIFVDGSHDVGIVNAGTFIAKHRSGKTTLMGLAELYSFSWAPEVLRKAETFASDVYAAAIALYLMLTGAYPYEGDLADVFSAMEQNQPISARQRNAAISASVDAFLRRCLSYDPAQRPRDAIEALRLWREAINHLPSHSMTLSWSDVREALRGERLPAAFVDLDALDRNLDRHVAALGARRIPIRVASKSVRVPALLRRLIERGGASVKGLMCFCVAEAQRLAEAGFDDLLVAYPPMQRADVDAAAALVASGKLLRIVADSREGIDALAAAGERAGVSVPVLLCHDLALSALGGAVFAGVRRSPLRAAEQVLAMARYASETKGVRFEGLMGYEAQIAGLGDDSPFERAMNPVKAKIKRDSVRDVASRREEIVVLLRREGLAPALVNGGGTGSMESTPHELSVTEVSAGSGFFKPHLFDYYRSPFVRSLEPACFFALEATRRPTDDIVTCLGGGYVASGSASRDKVPLPWLPQGSTLIEHEQCGEVQTPVRLRKGTRVELGDPVIFRHAKAGELAERFAAFLLLKNGAVVDAVKTYRGEGWCFLLRLHRGARRRE